MNLPTELSHAVEQAADSPVVLTDPKTSQRYVLVREDVYDRLKNLLYDDSPWTDAEKELLAAEAGESIGWDEMNEYDDQP